MTNIFEIWFTKFSVSVLLPLELKAPVRMWDSFWQLKSLRSFLFHRKSSFLRYLKFCPDSFSHVWRRLDKKSKINFKIYVIINLKRIITKHKWPKSIPQWLFGHIALLWKLSLINTVFFFFALCVPSNFLHALIIGTVSSLSTIQLKNNYSVSKFERKVLFEKFW